MQIRSRVFEKYEKYIFNIPLLGSDKTDIKPGKLNVGDILFQRSDSTLKKSINISEVFKCKSAESYKYVLKIDGEYVEKGEVLAEKTSSGKLSIMQIKSPISGVLDLSRITYGYIDILGEEGNIEFKSDFSGEILGINPIDGITISTQAVGIDGVVSSKGNDKLFGKLEILGDGNSILNEGALNQEYRGKIVWVGPYLYNRVATELFERGAVAVLTYAMSYTEFREIGLPIMILGGFGSVHCDLEFLKRFLSFKDKFLILDTSQNQIFILSESNFKNNGWFVNQYINQTVISRALSTYGYIGKIMEYDQESNNILVEFGKKGRTLMNIGLVDFIDL